MIYIVKYILHYEQQQTEMYKEKVEQQWKVKEK